MNICCKGKYLILLFSFFTFSPLFGQFSPLPSDTILLHKIKHHLYYGIQYLERSQIKETNPNKSFKGEWQTLMGLQRGFVMLGGRNFYEDSNCFSVASIHNLLARIYLQYPEYSNIPPILDLAFQRVMAYKNGDKFNFWNALPPNRDLFKGDDLKNQQLVRRPTNYVLTSRYINNAANVAEDADDTSLGYLAMALHSKVKSKYGLDSKDSLPQIGHIFEKYRDKDRKNFHWYNLINGNDRNTGAYLTWLGDEYQFDKWNLLKVLGHNATFYMSSSECFPHPYIPYIPYGTNDLDAVVNANVLLALYSFNETTLAGINSAVKFIQKKSKSEKYSRAGVYYPNRYQFPFAVSQAYSNGVTQLDTSVNHILKFVIKHQHKNGSWNSKWILNHKDRLQSTAYALNTLINIGNYDQYNTQLCIEKAINYIFENAIEDQSGIHWKGGVFFSGGTIVRNTLIWKSDAYTTVVILNALANYRKVLEGRLKISNNH